MQIEIENSAGTSYIRSITTSIVRNKLLLVIASVVMTDVNVHNSQVIRCRKSGSWWQCCDDNFTD